MSVRAKGAPGPIPGPSRRDLAVLAGALLAGAALRLTFIHDLRSAVLFQQPVLDSLEYLLMARRIREGHLLWDEVTIHSPLYAYWIAGLLEIFRDNLDRVRAAQAILVGAGTTLLVWAMARRCAGALAGGVSAWLAATLWPLAYHDTEILVESLVIVLNAAALVALMSDRGRPALLALAGCLLGLSTLTRPNAAAFIPVAALWAAWRAGASRRGGTRAPRAVAAAAVIAGATVVLAPVLLRNHALSGAWIFQRNGGLSFYMGNSPWADGTPNLLAGRPWERLVAMAPERGIHAPAAQDAYYLDLALEWIRENPGRAAALFGRKILLFWNAYETRPSLDIYYLRGLSPALSLPWPGFGTLAPLALWGAVVAILRRRPETDLLLLYALVYTLASAAFMVSSRYRIPIVPAALPLAGVAAQDLIERWRSGGARRVLVPGAALAALVLVVHWPPAGGRVRDNAEEHYNEGTRLMEAGRLGEAERAFRKAWAERQEDGRIATNLGALLLRTGRRAESLEWFRRGVTKYPEKAEMWGNLGAGALATGHFEESERAFRESLRLNPNSGPTRLGFGLLLLTRGDRPGAVREFDRARRLGTALPPEALAIMPPP